MNEQINSRFDFTVFSVEADIDYLICRLLTIAGGNFHPAASYHAQQSLEKYLKAIAIANTNSFIEGHDLSKLAGYNTSFDNSFNKPELIKDLNSFTPFSELGRYSAHSHVDPYKYTGRTIEVAGFRVWSLEMLKKLDNLVYFLRKKLNFQNSLGEDKLNAILNNVKGIDVVETWRLPIPLLEVLTRDNNYFINITHIK